MNRRELLRNSALITLGSALPRYATAAPTQNLKIGYASITWAGKDDQAIADISAAGYKGIQIRTDALKIYPEPAKAKADLAAHHLTFVAFSSGQTDLAHPGVSVDQHVEHAKYVRDAGGMYMQVVGMSDGGRAGTPESLWSDDDYKKTIDMLNEIGSKIAPFGVKLGLHNHMGGIVQTPAQTERILSGTDPKYVHLELDIAHCLQGGGDPVQAVHKYKDRLLWLHFKDVKDADTKSGYMFVELGQGRVPIPDVVKALKQVGYKGWAIVELDGVPKGTNRTPKECALLSKAYLEKIGVTV